MGRVALEHVSKRFDDVTAVDDLTLDVADEEFLVLLGPSGCGKSTALRMIAGLEEPSDGTITIGDRVVNDVEAKDRDIAMVFQSYALYPHMTVRRNIEFPLRSRKVSADERARLVQDAAESLGLQELLDRKPAQLSGGQRQRVALARAIVRRPAGVPDGRAALEPRRQAPGPDARRARRAPAPARRDGRVRHARPGRGDDDGAPDRDPRATVCSSRSGAPQDVYEQPANLFVARFIGSPPMNTVDGRVRTEGEGLVAELPGGRAPLPAPLAGAVTARGLTDVVIGVRPEDLRFAGTDP